MEKKSLSFPWAPKTLKLNGDEKSEPPHKFEIEWRRKVGKLSEGVSLDGEEKFKISMGPSKL